MIDIGSLIAVLSLAEVKNCNCRSYENNLQN